MYADAISFSKFVCSHVFFQYLQCSHFFFKEYWCECTLKRASTLKRGLRVFEHRNSSSPYKVRVYLTETKRQWKKTSLSFYSLDIEVLPYTLYNCPYWSYMPFDGEKYQKLGDSHWYIPDDGVRKFFSCHSPYLRLINIDGLIQADTDLGRRWCLSGWGFSAPFSCSWLKMYNWISSVRKSSTGLYDKKKFKKFQIIQDY